MSCCCTEDNRIIIIKKNDTDFNNGNLVEFNITSDIYNVADFTAELILGDIKREFNDLSYGIINFNLSKEETETLPYGNIDGVMNFIDSQGRVATISSIIPFRVIGIVENDAIKTSDVDYTINVEQGGKNIFNIDVKTNVSVRVGTVETLPSGSSAYVENVGTPTGVVLNFGIPQGIQGEQGVRGKQGIQGEKGDTGSKGEKGDKGDTGATGEAATIQVGTVTTLNPSEPAYVQNVGTEQNAIFNFGIPKGDSGSGANADFSDITGSPYDCDALAAALNEKQNVIEDLPDIRSGAELGSTAVQPSSLATVATSGSYNDLSNKPTIPPAQINSDWDASSGVSQILNKPNLATVATSGSYADLSNKPTIPDEQIQSDWTQSDNTKVDYIKNKPTLATVATSGSYTDLSNKPSIPQALSDIAVAGDNVTFKTPSNKDYVASSNKVNYPSIVNGLFTTTSSSYLQINNASISNYSGSIFTGNYSWAWTVKFKTPADVSEEHTIFRMGSSLTDFNVWCALSESTSTSKTITAALHLSDNTWTNSATGSGITEVKPNTWYWVRLSRDTSTNTYKFEISEDGEVWSTEISYVSTASLYNTKSDMLLSGQFGSNLGTTEYDLTGCSFTSNYSSGINWVAYIHDERTSINATVPSITVDQTYNASSTNAQSGKAVASALSVKQNVIEDLSDIRSGAELGSTAVQPSSLATVATSGSYNDLSNKPTLGTMASESASDYTKTSGLATVATSGDYDDLLDKPTIPSKTSDLNNDSGFITSSALSGYATENWVGQQGYITGITSSMVTTALGFTPYNSSNPNGYQENVIESIKVNGSALTPTNKAVDITVPSAVTESTVSGWGFTKNTGTVTSVNNISPIGGNVSIDLSVYQTTANLVTSVSSSSTDSQYPSAKCLYDLCGDIETLINAL